MPSGVSDSSPELSSIEDAFFLQDEVNRHFRSGNLEQALAIQEEVRQFWEAQGDAEREAESAQQVGLLRFLLRNHPGAIAAYERALELHASLGNVPAQIHTMARMAEALQHLGDHGKAVQLLLQAATLCEAAGQRKDQGIVLNNAGVSYRELGERLKAMDIFTQALRIRHELGDLEGLGATLHNLGALYLDCRMCDSALEVLEQAAAIRRSLEDCNGQARTALCLGRLYELKGDYARAEAYYDLGLQLAGQPEGSLDDQAAALLHLAETASATGQPTRALELLSRAQTIFTSLDRPASLAKVHYGTAMAHKALERPRQALHSLRQAQEVAESIGDGECLGVTMAAVGMILAESGEASRAHDFLMKALQLQELVADHETIGHTLDVLVQVCETLGRQDEAERHRRQALLMSAGGSRLRH